MTRTVDIRHDRLGPRTFGEMIDALIIMNIRMWHAQELFFDLDKLYALPHDQVLPLLTETTRLNLLRNQAMDGIDALLATHVERRFPRRDAQHQQPQTTDIIWEPV
ncbi:MAG: hypothetical protein KatS3mg039_1194 [Candidatus Kapaibacterium sp.]|nr:MAG: hypothetical protein KatS3mg039_1194 [Candidatus Kapabacteria bacterium]